MSKRSWVLAAGAAMLALAAAGCGGSDGNGGSKSPDPTSAEVSPPGDIPDNQAFVAYRPPGGGYSVKVPEGWARTASAGSVTFTDKLNSISITAVPSRTALTIAAAKRTEVPKLSRTVRGFRAGNVAAIKRPAGRVVRITYLADSKADSVTGRVKRNAVERYVFFRNGKRVIVTLTGPKGADNVDPWRIVTESVRYTP